MQNVEKAITDFDKVIALHDGYYAEAFCQRGIAFRLLDKYEQALADFDQAISLNPDDPSPYLNAVRRIC
jgi:tetratricopeptide (TPR) repeat protein